MTSTHYIGDTFTQFPAEKTGLIVISFGKLGLSLPVNRSLDHEVDIKGFDHLEIGN
ncbi:hypothetical protein L873DRAFT_1813548 [Choiromyces venosus 120613-1]|uniref:Uncharacterized protein n=1 Tax=Choiromyces venosus 120613-1 TaxID=1336337 RepID=A0A3N4JDB7_9PEZI|nr:hypothetical protein L873DRAFT_1813548 [Choiromyces venosus 120613-1]